ncbi:hypothetical protein [Microbacterium hydrocarbonoxydans]|uniref:hypothetical protein n=1 Tax=Microbacterium hydrocarbonoxydans TaxID=273678 RepID=UPI001910CE6A|nr:hypothetical protein [Microbacterium hydrocarbonoxydans]
MQRRISAEDMRWPGYLRAPHEAKPTAVGLWTTATDPLGRCELVPELIAAAIYPGQAATDLVIEHLLMLADSGFLTIYQERGSEWIALRRPLRVDARLASSDAPEPPHEHSRTFVAVGGAGERAGARVRAEQGERVSQWATWAEEQETRTRPPKRPLLMDAPPIGCPDHPSGRFKDCGPCGTARRRHDRWVQEARYGEQMTEYEQNQEAGEVWDDSTF